MKVARQLSVAILVVLCVAALYGSYCMISDPTGNSLGLPFYLLNGSVFSDYTVVGWVLLITVGLFSILVLIQIFLKSRFYSFLIMIQGVLICIFIIVQMLLLGETFMLQYFFLLAGIALICLGFLQNQRRIAVESERQQQNSLKPKSHHHKHRKQK